MIGTLRQSLSTGLFVIRRPGEFFSRMPASASPWPFALLVYVLSMGSCLLLNLWALGHGRTAIAMGGVAGALLGVVALGLWVVLGGLLLHGGLLVAGARGQPLRTTYAGLCYASAPLVISHVPYIGLPLGLGWMLILGIIAVHKIHGISWPRALLGVTLPVLLVVGVGLLLGAQQSLRTERSSPGGPAGRCDALLPGLPLYYCP